MRILLASPESHVWHSRAHIHMGSERFFVGGREAGGAAKTAA